MTVRVRFAPSPTGIPHIGNTRTALFNWLFAKHNHGKFIIRIEDTDRKRLVANSQAKIMEILDTVGLREDESFRVGGDYGPYIQSQRLDLYRKYADQLIDQGQAYYCFCSPERLTQVRKQQQKQGLMPKYDRHCLNLTKTDTKQKIKQGLPYVIRLKIPDELDISWNDLIQGPVTINSQNLDDQVLIKSDGYPTYNFAVVIDDYLMKISHVLRGAEFISSTPKHIILYKAFGWPVPIFGHFPIILGPDKAKLSKRHGAKSVLDYVAEGYLPEALVNFMVFLGWHYQDNSAVLSLKQLIDLFDITKVRKTNPIFDISKLNYFNKEHIKSLTIGQLSQKIKPFLPHDYPETNLAKLVGLCQPRMVTLKDFFLLTKFVYPTAKPDPAEVKKRLKDPIVIKALVKIREIISQTDKWEPQTIEENVQKLITDHNWPKGKIYMALRLIVLIRPVTPPLFESMTLLSRQIVIQRISQALKAV